MKAIFIITGSPGSGKTTLVRQLEAMGYRCAYDAATAYIQELIKQGKSYDTKSSSFNRAVAFIRMEQFLNAERGIWFFDRGLPDTLAYTEDEQTKKGLLRMCRMYRYSSPVFLLPPWKEIFEQHEGRKESFEEATQLSKLIKEAYEMLGYEVIELPKLSVKERANFVVEKVNYIVKRM